MDNRQKQIEQAKRLIATGISEELVEVLHQQFPELEESEEERIRKTLIHIVKGACDKYGIKYKGDDITKEKLLAYLERQKEPLTPEEKMNHPLYLEGFDVGRRVGEVVAKPAEWSEEDEKTIDEICCNLDYLLHNTICAEQTKVNLENRIKWLIRLKTLRPNHWKPSEEQIKALEDAKMRMSLDGYGLCPLLQTLINDLKKLL